MIVRVHVMTVEQCGKWSPEINWTDLGCE